MYKQNIKIMENLYAFRCFRGIAKYEVIGHSDDWSEVTAKDTTCTDHENCIVKLAKNGDSYSFVEPLNESAEKYIYFHEGVKYFETKEECFADVLLAKAKYYRNQISECSRIIENLSEKVLKRKLLVQYVTPENWSFNKTYYTEKYGTFEIVGKIEFKDGSYGWLIEWNDEYYDDIDDYDDRPTILRIDNGKLSFVMDKIQYVFNDEKSFENYKRNNENNRIKGEIKYNESKITAYQKTLDSIEDILRRHVEEGINYNMMSYLFNEIKK